MSETFDMVKEFAARHRPDIAPPTPNTVKKWLEGVAPEKCRVFNVDHFINDPQKMKKFLELVAGTFET